ALRPGAARRSLGRSLPLRLLYSLWACLRRASTELRMKVLTVVNSVMPQGVERASHYVPHTKVPTLVFPTSQQAARHVALMIEGLIRQNNSAGRPTILGLPTGSTPVSLYRELIRLHREAGLDFSRVITFNLDEYYPMRPDDAQSYRRWMQENFFNHVNIPT